jgi:hypothetical protein
MTLEDESAKKKKVRYSSAAEWACSYFQYSSEDGLMKCTAGGVQCKKAGKGNGFSVKTSKQNFVDHLLGNAHGFVLPDYLAQKKKVASVQSSGIKTESLKTHFATSDRETQVELVTIAYAMHPVAYHLLDDPTWRAAHRASLAGINGHTISTHTLELDKKKQERFLAKVSGPVALELDGGKSVSGAKLIAFVIIENGNPHLFKLLDTKLVELDGPTYRGFVESVVREFRARAPKAVIVSITLDNEASPNLGVKLMLAEEDFNYILHIQCGPHTLELLMEKIFTALPAIMEACDAVNNVARYVQNHKSVQKKLYEAQVSAGGRRVLRMRLSNNTRKWSGRFLANSRALELADFLTGVAAAEGEDFPALPRWRDVSDSQVILFSFYLMEQVLQRDRSGLLHYAWAFFQIVNVVGGPVNRAVAAQGDVEKANTLNKELDKIEEKFKRCGVLHLCFLLWPHLSQETREEHHAIANMELERFVNKRWDLWQTNAEQFNFPFRFRENEGGPSKKAEFLVNARQELTRHLLPDGTVREAQEQFRKDSVSMEEFLNLAGNAPKATLKTTLTYSEEGEIIKAFNTAAYYDSVAADLPILRFLAIGDLGKCAASEASTERVFSSEASVHDRTANLQQNDKTTARIRLGWEKKAELRRAAIEAGSGIDEY